MRKNILALSIATTLAGSVIREANHIQEVVKFEQKKKKQGWQENLRLAQTKGKDRQVSRRR